MEQTDHVMLVGQGALEFARLWGFKEENLLTEKSRLAWVVWKQSLRDGSDHNNWTDGLDAPGIKTGIPKLCRRSRMSIRRRWHGPMRWRAILRRGPSTALP